MINPSMLLPENLAEIKNLTFRGPSRLSLSEHAHRANDQEQQLL